MGGADGAVVITVTPAELPGAILRAWSAPGPNGRGIVPIVHGQPGIGKTGIGYQTAAMYSGGLPVWMLRLAQRDATALAGFHMPDLAAGTMRYLPGEDWPAGACVLFLDELNRAAQLTQNAAFELIEKGVMGGKSLHPDSRIIAAVNYAADGGGVQRMPSALANRFRHFHLVTDTASWCQWAYGASIDPLVVGYIRWRDGVNDPALHSFDAQADAWPSPRTWEFVSDTVKSGVRGRELLIDVAGDVGEARALEFVAFYDLASKLPSIDAILINPATEPVPTEVSQLYAVAAALAARITDVNCGRVFTYLERLPAEYMTFSVQDGTRRPEAHAAACTCDPCLRVDGITHSADYSRLMVQHPGIFG